MSTEMAWHYTIGQHAAEILSSGIIRPATAYVPVGETPVVWFSTRQHWEPTANKDAMHNGVRVSLNFEQTIERGGGGWRFGLSIARLIPWKVIKAATNMDKGHARALEFAALPMAFVLSRLSSIAAMRC